MDKLTKLKPLLTFNFPQLYYENLVSIQTEIEKLLRELWPNATKFELATDLAYNRLIIENEKVTDCDFSSDADFINIWPNKMYDESKNRNVTIVFDSESDFSEEITIWFQDDNSYTEAGEGFTKTMKKSDIATEAFLKSIILWLEKLEKI